MYTGESTPVRAALYAQIMALSDEREVWLQRLLDAERAAYEWGYAQGRADADAERDRADAAALEPLPDGWVNRAPFAEMQERRYGPDSWRADDARRQAQRIRAAQFSDGAE